MKIPVQPLLLATLYIYTYAHVHCTCTLKQADIYIFPEHVDMSCSPGEIELRLSQLPPWAQKQMLSRPSVAQSVSSATAAASSAAGLGGGGGGGGVGAPPRPPDATAADTGETAAPLEGKWAQVSESRHVGWRRWVDGEGCLHVYMYTCVYNACALATLYIVCCTIFLLQNESLCLCLVSSCMHILFHDHLLRISLFFVYLETGNRFHVCFTTVNRYGGCLMVL